MRLRILGCVLYVAAVISAIDAFTFGQANTPAGWVFTNGERFLIVLAYLGTMLFVACGFLIFFKPLATYLTGVAAALITWPVFFPVARQVVRVLIEDPRFQFTRLHGINDTISVSLLSLVTLFSSVQAWRTFKLVDSE